jgi:hypothetical protein
MPNGDVTEKSFPPDTCLGKCIKLICSDAPNIGYIKTLVAEEDAIKYISTPIGEIVKLPSVKTYETQHHGKFYRNNVLSIVQEIIDAPIKASYEIYKGLGVSEADYEEKKIDWMVKHGARVIYGAIIDAYGVDNYANIVSLTRAYTILQFYFLLNNLKTTNGTDPNFLKECLKIADSPSEYIILYNSTEIVFPKNGETVIVRRPSVAEDLERQD